MVLLIPVLAPIWFAYGFGDASPKGFGVKSQQIAQLLRICIGSWCNEYYEKTSNKCEYHNLCNHIKEDDEARRFNGYEFCMGADRKVSERIWYKGGSTDKE